jgi:hypothetical protein
MLGRKKEAKAGGPTPDMKLTRDQVRMGYYFVLEREPESEAVYGICDLLTLDEFRYEIKRSDEAQDRMRERIVFKYDDPYDFVGCHTLYFIHLEKCGGTTVHDVMKTYFEPHKVTSEHLSSIYDLSVGECANYDFISGHFDYYSTLLAPRTHVHRIAVFREPINRLISFYRFHRAHPEHMRGSNEFIDLAHRLGPLEFFTDPRVLASPRTNNAYLRTFGTSRYQAVPDGESEHDRRAAFDRAAERIVGLDGIGLTERMNESLASICRGLGYAPPDQIEYRYKTDELGTELEGAMGAQEVEVTPELTRQMEEITRYDSKLYDLAVGEFERRLRETESADVKTGQV